MLYYNRRLQLRARGPEQRRERVRLGRGARATVNPHTRSVFSMSRLHPTGFLSHLSCFTDTQSIQTIIEDSSGNSLGSYPFGPQDVDSKKAPGVVKPPHWSRVSNATALKKVNERAQTEEKDKIQLTDEIGTPDPN